MSHFHDDMEENGCRKAVNASILTRQGQSSLLLKNRWVAIHANGITCYAQWQDVGPFERRRPLCLRRNAEEYQRRERRHRPIPAVRDCLKVGGLAKVLWRHVNWRDVPSGP